MGESLKYLVEAMKKGDMSVFDQFYNQTHKQVFYIIYGVLKDKSLTEDIMQDAYMKVIEQIHNLKNSNIRSYIMTIGKNLAINEYNRRKKVTFSEEIFDTYQSPITMNIEISEGNRELIEKVLTSLTAFEKDVFLLHTLENFRHREIAQILDKPLGTITWTYQSAIKKIKDKLKEETK